MRQDGSQASEDRAAIATEACGRGKLPARAGTVIARRRRQVTSKDTCPCAGAGVLVGESLGKGVCP